MNWLNTPRVFLVVVSEIDQPLAIRGETQRPLFTLRPGEHLALAVLQVDKENIVVVRILIRILVRWLFVR
jgi:hypothetical protein